ncbi:MAG: YhgE/Pip domain-containing protein [Bifidobacterium psychraerophilum]|uniref:YhgE/Pip family protein n=1 Tax=Bifidobacterium psychraerophilum TaxID=218140 RepID=UPI0039ED4953
MKNTKNAGRIFLVLVVIAVSLIPALYNLIFLSSMWDPYGNVENLPVAVVNEDEPATVSGNSLSLGKQIVTSLKKQDGLDYHFVSAEQGDAGIADGTYYMEVTLPSTLSKQAGTLLGDSPTVPTITYTISEGRNYTASKMVTSAATSLKNSVSQQLTEIYVKTLLAKFSDTGSALQTAQQGTAKLQDGTVQIAAGSDKLSANLLKLSKGAVEFSDGANTLTVGIKAYTGGVSSVNTGVGKLSTGSAALSSGASQLVAKGNELVSGLSTLSSSSRSGAQQLTQASNSLTSGVKQLSSSMTMSDAQTAQIQQLTAGLPKLNTAIQQLNAAIQQFDTSSQMNALAEAANTSKKIEEESQALSSEFDTLLSSQEDSADQNVKNTAAFRQLGSADQQQILDAIDSGISQTKQVTSLKANIVTLKDNSSALYQKLSAVSSPEASSKAVEDTAALKQASAAIAGQSAQALPGAAQAINTLDSGLSSAKNAIDSQLLPGTQQLSSGISTYGNAVSGGATKLGSASRTYVDAVGTLGSGINTLGSGITTLAQGTGKLSSQSDALIAGSQKLASASSSIADGSAQLKSGEDTVGTALTQVSSGLSTMSTKFGKATSAIRALNTTPSGAAAVSAPLKLNKTVEASVPNNGTAMAPYMMSVALFVGALSFNMMFEAGVPRYRPRSGWHWWRQKMPLFLLVSIAQASLVFAAVTLLGLHPLNPALTLLMLIFEALGYMSLITVVNVIFGKVGAFLMLLFLMVQLAGSGGTYPVVLSNSFFKAVNPWLPMTHAIDGLRKAISIGGNINGQLALFLVMFLVTNLIMLLTFSLRRRSILVKPSDSVGSRDYAADAPTGGSGATATIAPAVPA